MQPLSVGQKAGNIKPSAGRCHLPDCRRLILTTTGNKQTRADQLQGEIRGVNITMVKS
jgi:hypothetical protein